MQTEIDACPPPGDSDAGVAGPGEARHPHRYAQEDSIPMMNTLAIRSTTGYLDRAGTRIAYEVIGTGYPIVLIHAGIADARMWDDQIDAFAEYYRVIRYDLRGFGRSDPASGTFSHRDDLVALLDLLNIERAHLVGLSRGGRLAVDFALEHPERVSALVSCATWPSGQEPSPELAQTFSAVDKALEAGDLDGAVERELRVWVDGPYRQPGDVSPRIRESSEKWTPLFWQQPTTGTKWRSIHHR